MKHAFLIMAHSNYPFLARIIKKIDHRNNTVFIHIDAKSKFTEQDAAMLKNSCQQSELHFVERHRVTWGGYSQINIELRMLEAALPMKFDYYHLMSGADFLIKPMEAFHRFFEENKGYEFVNMGSDDFAKENYYRVAQYHFFRDLCGRNRKNPLYWLNSAAIKFQQKILHIDRLKNRPDIELKVGANWFSITHQFAEYLFVREDYIRKVFSYSHCADEVFAQTILAASPFADKVYGHNLRFVDWTRPGCQNGAPHTFTVEDYDLLINSDCLICRKVTDQTPEGEALIQKLEMLS